MFNALEGKPNRCNYPAAGLGTIDVAAVARSVLMIGRSSYDHLMRVMVPIKSSLAPEGCAYGFRLNPERGFEWVGPCEYSAEDILYNSGETVIEGKLVRAKKLLENLLIEDKSAMDDTMITPDKEEQTYIHFGADHFIPELFCPIRNHTWMDKPMGGFWASRVDDEFGWNQWCRENRYKLHNLKHSFRFRLMDAQIITLNSPEQLTSLPLLNPWKPKEPPKVAKGEWPTEEQLLKWLEPNVCHLDYEKLAEEFDAIELRNSLSFREPLSTWDCDCILVMNPEKIIEL